MEPEVLSTVSQGRETMVYFSGTQASAEVYTCNRVWQRTLNELSDSGHVELIGKEENGGKLNRLPKKMVRIPYTRPANTPRNSER
jgi:hypothetical protein